MKAWQPSAVIAGLLWCAPSPPAPASPKSPATIDEGGVVRVTSTASAPELVLRPAWSGVGPARAAPCQGRDCLDRREQPVAVGTAWWERTPTGLRQGVCRGTPVLQHNRGLVVEPVRVHKSCIFVAIGQSADV